MQRWAGRVAVVTGASGGIGACISTALVKHGLKVVGIARGEGKVKDLAASLNDKPGKLYPLKADLTKESELKAAFDWVKKNLGGVDILVNNAGGDFSNTLLDGPVEAWRSMLDLNVMALSICTKEAVKSMRERGVDDGHVVNINSILGHVHAPAEMGFSMYTASKHAVTALNEGLRRELVQAGSKIRVTSVSPGVVKTNFVASSGTKYISPEEMYSKNPHLLPEDVADAVVYALQVPHRVQVYEIQIKPTGEVF